MEGKELNLNQPFLSVRSPPIPYYKSELRSGPVGKKGAVPFHWEQTPGNPREEITTTMADRLQSAAAPMLPPEEHGNNTDKTDDDDDEDYEDALDTLSRTNSTFLNCSVSGVSGLEDSDVKPCRDFARDPNTLNFVMDRFLPAAKAMVSDKRPQYMPKRTKEIRGELSKDLAKKMVIKKEDRDRPSLRYGPSYANRSSYDHVTEKFEEEDGESDYDGDDDHGQGCLIPSGCGLLPRFCLNGSSAILNPVGTHIAKSHGNKIRNRFLPNCSSNPEIRDGFEPEICDVERIEANRTLVIEENETTTGFKPPPKRVSKTFRQLLTDEDGCPGSDAEKVLSFDKISVPNEALRSRDEADKDEEEHANSPSKGPKKLHPMDISNDSSAADDIEIEPKRSEILGKKYSEIVNSPPLPKSPSDSWLWWTLPSVSIKNEHRHSNLGTNGSTQILNPKVTAGSTMWEAIVKSSKQQHDNSHYPEETLTPLQKT